MKQHDDAVKEPKEPYAAPLLTQHAPLRALTGQSGKTNEKGADNPA
jgi:hypothetical protein